MAHQSKLLIAHGQAGRLPWLRPWQGEHLWTWVRGTEDINQKAQTKRPGTMKWDHCENVGNGRRTKIYLECTGHAKMDVDLRECLGRIGLQARSKRVSKMSTLMMLLGDQV